VWSGGLPRDLIRVARRCVELRRYQGKTSIDQLSASIIAEDIAQTLVALRNTEYAAVVEREQPVPSKLTEIIDELNRNVKTQLNNQQLCDVLLRYVMVNDLPQIIRASTTKVIVAGVLSAAFASAVARGGRVTGGDATFEMADDLANITAMQSAPLGEMLAACVEVLHRMDQLRIAVPSDISRLVNVDIFSERAMAGTPVRGKLRRWLASLRATRT
jgi:hypothetical protein